MAAAVPGPDGEEGPALGRVPMRVQLGPRAEPGCGVIFLVRQAKSQAAGFIILVSPG